MTSKTDLLSLVIQAGGRSSRMGEDKALKLFLGQPLIQRVVDRLAPIASEILVTANRPDEYAFLGLRVIPDLLPGNGALGGLYTALVSATYSVVAVVGCDMPFASPALFHAAARLLVEKNVDVVIPRSEGGLETMHAVYRKETCLGVVREAIKANQLKIIDWFPRVRVLEQTPEDVAKFDLPQWTFLNVNTPAEFTLAEQREAAIN